MGISVDDYDPSGKPISSTQSKLLDFAFGETDCVDGAFIRFTNALAIPVIATIFFILLSIRALDDLMAQIIPDFTYRLVVKSIIFFLLIWLLDTLIDNWRKDVQLC